MSRSDLVVKVGLKERWGGKPAYAKCQSTRVWAERDGRVRQMGLEE